MKFSIFLFFSFILLLYIFFLQVDFSENNYEEKNKPDLVLLGAKIDNFLMGNLQFKVNAEKIEIYENIYFMYNSNVIYENGPSISANLIKFYSNDGIILASNNVSFEQGKYLYNGNNLKYNTNTLLLNATGGGKFLIQ
jgi:hypothetical protein